MDTGIAVWLRFVALNIVWIAARPESDVPLRLIVGKHQIGVLQFSLPCEPYSVRHSPQYRGTGFPGWSPTLRNETKL